VTDNLNIVIDGRGVISWGIDFVTKSTSGGIKLIASDD
jgi:hypothetical protein